ncbi:MAG: hypothetical protein IJ083_05280 [Clostridia bacterium]|nr:hypothetical protein [Clostridia bacterium]
MELTAAAFLARRSKEVRRGKRSGRNLHHPGHRWNGLAHESGDSFQTSAQGEIVDSNGIARSATKKTLGTLFHENSHDYSAQFF